MWPLPLHLRQRPNGRTYSDPSHRAAAAMAARMRVAFTAAQSFAAAAAPSA